MEKHNIGEKMKAMKKNGWNKEFTFTTPKTILKRVALGGLYQMCSICQVVCCQVCQWPSNGVVSTCTYFKNHTTPCPKCPRGCPRSAHCRDIELINEELVEIQQVINAKEARVLLDQCKEVLDQFNVFHKSSKSPKLKILSTMPKRCSL